MPGATLPNPRLHLLRIHLRRGPTLAVLLAVAIVAGGYLGSPNFSDHARDTGPYGGDFMQEWIGGQIVLHGDPRRFYDTRYAIGLQHDVQLVGYRWNNGRYLPIIYPPFYYAIVSPLALLPMKTAALVWASLMVAALVLTAGVLVKIAGDHAVRLSWMLPAAVLFAPMIENLVSSQKATLILLILASTYLLLIRGMPRRAGLVFGLLAFKPHLTLVIALAMLCKRQWSFTVGGAITGALLVGLSLFVGVDVCSQYFRLAVGMGDYIQTAGYDLHKAHCWYGFFALLLNGSPPLLIKTITLAASVATIILVARILRGPLQTDAPRFALQYSALVVATVLLSPHLLSYDLSILLLPMFLLAVELTKTAPQPLSGQRRALVWLLLASYVAGSLSTPLSRITAVQISVLVMVGLLAALAVVCESPAATCQNLISRWKRSS